LKAELFHFAQPGIFSSAFGRCGNNFHPNIMAILAKTVSAARKAWKLLSQAHGKFTLSPRRTPRKRFLMRRIELPDSRAFEVATKFHPLPGQ
jgi:hypothetical protein